MTRLHETMEELASSANSAQNNKQRYGLGSKMVIMCTISAAFAACSTSLLFIFVMKGTNNIILGACPQLDHLEELNRKLDQPNLQFQDSVDGFNSLESHLTEGKNRDIKALTQNSNETPRGLDFAIIGWPKTGTSFLHRLLSEHPEITMPEDEFCEIHADPGNLVRWIQETHNNVSLTTPTAQKTGIKCPTGIKNTYQVETLMKLSSDTRLIIGVRHPVLWFESFYNYRVKEVYDRNLPKSNIKPALHLNSQTHWNACSVAFAKFDLFLKQLAKVSLTMEDTFEMGQTSRIPYWTKRVTINPYKVFIYDSEQLSDSDASRQDQFRKDLQDYLELDSQFPHFNELPKVNSNNVRHPEYIDICDPQYDRIKQTLLIIGKKSSIWIQNKFIKSKDVVVSNEEHFIKTLRTWGRDPCEVRNKKNGKDVLNVVSASKGDTEAFGREVFVV